MCRGGKPGSPVGRASVNDSLEVVVTHGDVDRTSACVVEMVVSLSMHQSEEIVRIRIDSGAECGHVWHSHYFEDTMRIWVDSGTPCCMTQ